MKKILAITSTLTFLGMFAVLASAQRPTAANSTPGYYNSQGSNRRYDVPRVDYRYPSNDHYDDRKRRDDHDYRDRCNCDHCNDYRYARDRRGRDDRDHHHHHDHDRYSDRRRDDYRDRGYVDYRDRDRYEKSRGNCGPRDRDKRRW